MSATHVSRLGALLQLRLDTIQCRKPGGQQIRVISRTKEFLRAFEQLGMMFVPTNTLAVAKSLHQPLHIVRDGNRRQEEARNVRRTVLLR